MRFALLGDHPDGLAFVCALVEAGRHGVAVYSGPRCGLDALRQKGIQVQPIGDLEEVLADPAIDAVIVASASVDRPAHLRRALQSERHVVCVHPADQVPDMAYEAAMIQGDTGQVLMPLLPDALHPGIIRLKDLINSGALGSLCLLTWECWKPRDISIDDDALDRLALPGWNVLRALAGEVAELSAFATAEEITTDAPLLLAGRFTSGGLFRATVMPDRAKPLWQLVVTGNQGQATLSFAEGWPGPAQLTWRDEAGQAHEEHWDAWDPWPEVVAAFEAMVGPENGFAGTGPQAAPGAVLLDESEAITAVKPRQKAPPRPLAASGQLCWQDEVRCLELDSAARRSVHYRRVSVLEYQEASEEVGFKGTMTLVGCGLLWSILLLLVLSIWQPLLGWLIVPVLAVFLIMQMLRWIVPEQKPKERREPE